MVHIEFLYCDCHDRHHQLINAGLSLMRAEHWWWSAIPIKLEPPSSLDVCAGLGCVSVVEEIILQKHTPMALISR
jgi:hypothetical protein